jgi:hypothetical protein
LKHSFIILKIVKACSVYTLYNTSGYPKSKVSVTSSLNSRHYNVSNAGFSWFQSILGEKQYYKPKHGNYPQLRARKCDQKLWRKNEPSPPSDGVQNISPRSESAPYAHPASSSPKSRGPPLNASVNPAHPSKYLRDKVP